MATAWFCTRLKQALPSSTVTTALSRLRLVVYHLHTLLVEFPTGPVNRIPIFSIFSLVLAPIALRKWGSSLPSFLASSITTEPPSGKMLQPIPEGQVFFLEWPTWGRLAIILSGSLVAILLIAYLVRLKNWARDKRQASREAAEQAERGEMSTADEEEIPFGIRALLEDPEVEGVWNSGEVTPMHLDGAACTPSVSQLVINPSKPSADLSITVYDTADAGLPSPTALTPLTGLPLEQPTSRKEKGKTLVISYDSPYLQGDSAEIEPGYTGIGSATTKEESKQAPSKMPLRKISNTSSSGPRKFVIGGRQKTSHRQQRQNTPSEVNPIERMEAHRRLHSAESGQLLPRHRRSSDMTQASILAPFASDSEDSDDPNSRALSWPPRNSTMHLGKQLSRRVQRMEGPTPVPFRAFVESLPTSKPPPSAWTDKTQAKMDSKVSSSTASDTSLKTSGHTPTSSMSSTASVTAPTSSPSDSLSLANTRSRKVNAGFELLPAGSLEKGSKVKEFGTWHNNVEKQKKPNKLQKRSRSGSVSRSSTESHRTSNDSFRLPIF